jgi:hypothetical protein
MTLLCHTDIIALTDAMGIIINLLYMNLFFSSLDIATTRAIVLVRYPVLLASSSIVLVVEVVVVELGLLKLTEF